MEDTLLKTFFIVWIWRGIWIILDHCLGDNVNGGIIGLIIGLIGLLIIDKKIEL
jgi:hypothetical protein